MIDRGAIGERGQRMRAARGRQQHRGRIRFHEQSVARQRLEDLAFRRVALAEEKKVGLEKLSLDDLRSIHPGITDGIFSVLAVQNSVKSRVSFGGTAPSEVRKQIRYWKKRLAKA